MPRYKDPGAMPTTRDNLVVISKIAALIGLAFGGYYLLAKEGYVGMTTESPSGPVVIPMRVDSQRGTYK